MKWRQSIIALLVLMIVWAIGGCAGDKNDSTGDESDGSVPIESVQATVAEITPETQSEADTESPTETNNAASGEGHEVHSAEESSRLLPLLPEGWHVMEDAEEILPPSVATGDLNADGIPDVAAVIEGPVDPECECAPRSLLLAFGREDDSLELSILSDEVVLAANEGGVFGDPFDGIAIERGTLLVSDYGGSNWRWYNRYRFRYQDEAWCLIGYTTGSYFTGTTEYDDADEDDYNLLTGDYVSRRTNEEGQVVTTKGNRGKKELVKLGEFDLSNM